MALENKNNVRNEGGKGLSAFVRSASFGPYNSLKKGERTNISLLSKTICLSPYGIQMPSWNTMKQDFKS